MGSTGRGDPRTPGRWLAGALLGFGLIAGSACYAFDDHDRGHNGDRGGDAHAQQHVEQWRTGDGHGGDGHAGGPRAGDVHGGDMHAGDWRGGDRRDGDHRDGDHRDGDHRDGDWRDGRGFRPAPGPRGQFFDDRYNHGHYYPPRGYHVDELPGGYRPYYWHGDRYFFAGGAWYSPGPFGFVVVRPPIGLFVNVLPPFYTTVWFGGVPYYYADDVYYRWDPDESGYVVVSAPTDAEQPSQPPPPEQAAPEYNFYIYPKNGQSAEQQAADRYECHRWAKGQTGFDPTESGGGVAPDQTGPKGDEYRRAMTACLEARGYSVR